MTAAAIAVTAVSGPKQASPCPSDYARHCTVSNTEKRVPTSCLRIALSLVAVVKPHAACPQYLAR